VAACCVVKGTSLGMRLTVGVSSVLRCERHTYSQTHSQKRTLTQQDMLPQHPINITYLLIYLLTYLLTP